MTLGNFKDSLSRVLAHEGGKVDHPKDPGGRTAYGVTQRVYDGYRKNMGAKPRDVFNIMHAEVEAIYHKQYWAVVQGDRLPKGVDYVVFDGAVNSGPKQSVLWLQRALGGVKVDGILGEATLAAVASHTNHDALVASICEQRMKFLKALKTWGTFGKGWTRRVESVLETGQAWATGEIAAPTMYAKGGDEKALEADLQKAPSQVVGAVVATAGLGIPQILDGISKVGDQLPAIKEAVEQAKSGLVEYVVTFPFLQPVIDHLTTIGAVVATAGLVWTIYGKAKAALISDAANLKVA